MQHFRFTSDKRFKTFKEGLMHPKEAEDKVVEDISKMKIVEKEVPAQEVVA
jgi:hypothetical protein